MNKSELEVLHLPITNDAKLLYCIGLRPTADEKTAITQPLAYKQLLTLLNGKEKNYTLGRQLNKLIGELVEVGLINFTEQVDSKRSFNGKTVMLPLMLIQQQSYDELHMQWHKMNLQWKPNDKLFIDLAGLVGIIDKEYSVEELGDFIAYWLGRPENNFSTFQWTQKFVFHIKKKRLAYGKKNTHKIGNQLVTAKAGISTSSNVKKLVEKYGGKHKAKTR